MSKAEALLKVGRRFLEIFRQLKCVSSESLYNPFFLIQVILSPIDSVADTYRALLPEGTPMEFQRILELKVVVNYLPCFCFAFIFSTESCQLFQNGSSHFALRDAELGLNLISFCV